MLNKITVFNRLYGAGGCNWNAKFIINNVYVIQLKRKNGEAVVYAKFGSKTFDKVVNDFYYGEFIDHVKKFENKKFKNAIVCNDYNTSEIVSFSVYNVPKIDFHTNLNYEYLKTPFDHARFEDVYMMMNSIFDSYDFTLGNFWHESINEDLLKMPKMDFLENMTTALLEPFGHLACADVLKEYLQKAYPNDVFNSSKFFNTSDRSKDGTTKRTKFLCGYTYAAERWAFSNSCEFVGIVFPKDYDIPPDIINLITKQIIHTTVSYTLHFINSYYQILGFIPPNMNISARTQILMNPEPIVTKSPRKIFSTLRPYSSGCAKIVFFPDTRIDILPMSTIKTVTETPIFYNENDDIVLNYEVDRLRDNSDFIVF